MVWVILVYHLQNKKASKIRCFFCYLPSCSLRLFKRSSLRSRSRFKLSALSFPRVKPVRQAHSTADKAVGYANLPPLLSISASSDAVITNGKSSASIASGFVGKKTQPAQTSVSGREEYLFKGLPRVSRQISAPGQPSPSF